VSLETVSTKRNRTYHRHFDHDEARRLRAEGWSWAKLADRFGVTPLAVTRVCNPDVAARMLAKSNEATRRKRTPCRGGCGRLVWMHQKGRSGYCAECVARRKTAADVRDGELRCTQCREWKPDEEFPTWHGQKSRRGHSAECQACATKWLWDYRAAHPESKARESRRHTDRIREEKPMSLYVVLHPNGTGDSYVEVARVDAGSPAHAIEKVATDVGEYIAVPASRFQRMRVEPVQAFRVVTEKA